MVQVGPKGLTGQASRIVAISFPCHYLAVHVELTDERLAHLRAGHPELVHPGRDRIARTLGDRDEIRRDSRFPGTRLFSRWFDDLLGGKIVGVAVVTDDVQAESPRHRVVTAYVTRRITRGTIEWSRP